ncbi:hypothetical protein [Exiguobacterium artemiae]|uniref:hypothetical protein n=1 Tax=Exiguobacterium artemiae TaxID=340145 RepID=UPI002963FF31|nr:hypothetical protein [Exiguobacterium sibiricum]MDW2886677.1 hypothetical protein [Exiguobacterium sibiricum]
MKDQRDFDPYLVRWQDFFVRYRIMKLLEVLLRLMRNMSFRINQEIPFRTIDGWRRPDETDVTCERVLRIDDVDPSGVLRS